jgi:hypothetical protein
MIDMISTVQIVLREAGFSTRLLAVERITVVCFEDDALVGFCSAFDSIQELLRDWRAREMSILRRFSTNFHAAGDKAWNVYSAFLCSASPDSETGRKVRWIEEDLERTRKIAACGVASHDDVVHAFLPVLPLQYQPALLSQDTTERLQKRIGLIAPSAVKSALDPNMPESEVVRQIGEAL